jgi:2-iminobutanoate/2-iminopropanoate deaminase
MCADFKLPAETDALERTARNDCCGLDSDGTTLKTGDVEMANLAQAYNRRDLEKHVGYSQAVLAGDYLFISGCVSWDTKGNPLHAGDFASQLETVYADIDATLKAHGMDAGNVVKETVYTTDMDALVAANPRRVKYYQHATPPASTWVQITRLVHPDLLLEVEITAFSKR